MRAVRIHGHGGPDILRVDEIPEPTAGPGELLVRLRATSINHRDVWIRKGHPHPAYHVRLPAILGIDICGEVIESGSGVEGFRPGERVTANPYAHCGSCAWCIRGRFQYCPHFTVYSGAYAEVIVLPASLAIPIRSDVPDEHVASFPNTYITAWQMLFGKACVSASDTVFVWAGTSGLGSAAIDIAKLAGAFVIATAGTAEKRAVLESRKADAVLDHHDPELLAQVAELTNGNGATIIFEHVGQATFERSVALCSVGGTIVSAGATSGDDARIDVTAMFVKQVRILGSRLGTMEDALAAAAQLDEGRFDPLVGRVITFEDVAEGHRLLESGDAIGKIVVKPTLTDNRPGTTSEEAR